MNRKLTLRLALDCTSGGLLLLCMAYWWLGNFTHEVAGTSLFGLLVVHNVLNRRWYTSLRRRQAPRPTLDKLLVAALLAAMATLLITSVLISQTVFTAIAPADAHAARRVHLAAAYWALIIVALHIGSRWRVLLGAMRQCAQALQLPWQPPRAARALVIAVLAAAGIYSSFQLGIGGKLVSRMSLDGWDFVESTLAFFVHHLAVVGLYASLAHQVFHRWAAARRLKGWPT
ncbi:MAG: DUF4405 domain-containing protein [Burkholderiaceae bacterium]|nr:DUF4405 domain-containing protein [Burkholderiaceae bacterium]